MRATPRVILVLATLGAMSLTCISPSTPQPTAAPPPATAISPSPTSELPTATSTAESTAVSATATPTSTSAPMTPTAEVCTPDSEYVADVTLPDGSLISPGETFTKTWRIRNDGTCTWRTNYTWDQIDASGNKLLASPLSKPLTTEVPPGGTLDVSVQITLSASATLGSSYTARFQLRSPSGVLFGTHPYTQIFAVNGTGVCPVGNASQKTFIHLSDRYCFLYPGDHNAYIGVPGNTMVVAPPPPGPGEHVVPFVEISNVGNTGGASLTSWSNARIAAAMAPGSPPTVTNTTIGGEPAKIADTLPGIMSTRVVYVIHNNIGFEIAVYPKDASVPAETTQALALWETIRSSFVFFAP